MRILLLAFALAFLSAPGIQAQSHFHGKKSYKKSKKRGHLEKAV